MSDADSPTEATKDTAARVRRGLDYALLAGLAILGFIAAIQFYLAADSTINVWVTREYRPPFKMVFNLVILLVVGIGLSRQVRRLTGDDADDADDDRRPDATTDGGVEPPSVTTGEQSVTASEATDTRVSGDTARAGDDETARAGDDDSPGDESPSDADRS